MSKYDNLFAKYDECIEGAYEAVEAVKKTNDLEYRVKGYTIDALLRIIEAQTRIIEKQKDKIAQLQK